MQLSSVIEILFGNDNERRTQAELFIEQIPLNSFEQGIDAFIASMGHQNPQVPYSITQVSTMAALLLKKKYLDDTTNFQKIPGSKLEFIVGSVKNMILPEKSLTFLKRCCEILVKLFTHIVFIYLTQKQER